MRKKKDALAETPEESWSLDQLSEFCVNCKHRLAIDAWLFGKACSLAKQRCKEERKLFTDWKKRNGFSNATVSRHVRLYEAFQTDGKRQLLTKIGIMEGMARAGIIRKKEPVSSPSSRFEAKRHIKSFVKVAQKSDQVPTQPSGPPSWAVMTADDEPPSAPDEPEVDIWSAGESLQEICRRVFPEQVSMLNEMLNMLMKEKAVVLRKAWPRAANHRTELLGQIGEAIAKLQKLAATISQSKRMLAKAG